MEYNLKKSSVGVLQPCLDTVAEQPVDIDFTLPDYCPDIEKILKCKITPKIYNKNISGGQIQIDGTTVVTILYVDGEKSNLRACEQSVPFSATFQVKGLCENNVVDITTKPEYINCRALSPRRLAVHGAFSLYVKAVTLDNICLYSPDENANLECDTSEIQTTALTSLSQCQFTVCEEMTVSNKPQVEVLLTSDVKASITDYKIVSEKIMLNGELSVKLLYLSSLDKGDLQQLDYIIPFSQIMDCENLTDDGITRISLNVMSSDIHIKSEPMAENNSLSIDVKLSATVYGYSHVSCNIINDAYSTDIYTEIERNNISLITDVNIVKDTFMLKDCVSLAETGITEIRDIGWDNCVVNSVINGEVINLSGKANISILGFNDENIPMYVERSLDFTKDIQCNFNFNSVTEINCEIASLSYRIGEDNNLELRCEIKYCISTVHQQNLTVVSAVSGDEENKVQKSPCALTLYYAQAGEKLWDVAKAYNTKPELLFEENNIESKILEESKMLLIPIV